MADRDLDGAISPEDVTSGFRLAFGRDPESEDAIRDKQRFNKLDFLKIIFTSPEFLYKTYQQVLHSEPIAGGLFDTPPTAELSAWAAEFCPLTDESVENVRASRTWNSLFFNLFSDRVLTGTVLNADDPLTNDAFLSALANAHTLSQFGSLEGRIETFSAHEMRGWAVNKDHPDRVLEIELHLNGVFAAAATTNIFRRDLQEAYGGNGQFGFVIRRRPSNDPEGRALRAEVKEATTGFVLGVFDLLPRDRLPFDEVAALRRELSDLRAVLDRIEHRLPNFNASFGFTLSAYDEYFRAFYAPRLQERPDARSTLDICVVLDAHAAGLDALDRAMRSVERQTTLPSWLIIVHDGGDLALEIDAVLAQWRTVLPPGVEVVGLSAAEGGWTAAMNAAIDCTSARRILTAAVEASLSPRAIEVFGKRLQAGAVLVFADDDLIEPGDRAGAARHADPRLRTHYDHDLLLQQPALGSLIGFDRDAVRRCGGLRAEFEPVGLYDLALRLSEAAAPAAIVHVPEILAFLTAAAREQEANSLEQRIASVQDHLARVEPDAIVERHSDVLGNALPAALRVRRPAEVRTATAAVIVPTRDRLDLLGPCIASLLAAQTRNHVRTELIVVDNRSSAATTRAFLASFAALTQIKTIEHDGAFNWALMNNRAAAATDADVLIFLNNDTVVLSPDWCDELCEQALRPHVGAVGARLLYEDGTIQHAGVVLGGVHSFAAHEGVGAGGADPGYLDRQVLVRQVTAVTGACLATRASVFREFGGFDAVNYPVEANDIDYCLRLREQGLAVIYNPYATLYHFESKSRGFAIDEEKKAHAARAARKLRDRWEVQFDADPFYNPHFDRLSPPLTRLGPPPFAPPT